MGRLGVRALATEHVPHAHFHVAAGGNPDSNTLISDMTTVICLDDYHAHDRNGRKARAHLISISPPCVPPRFET